MVYKYLIVIKTNTKLVLTEIVLAILFVYFAKLLSEERHKEDNSIVLCIKCKKQTT